MSAGNLLSRRAMLFVITLFPLGFRLRSLFAFDAELILDLLHAGA
jgi:hypothetical protein